MAQHAQENYPGLNPDDFPTLAGIGGRITDLPASIPRISNARTAPATVEIVGDQELRVDERVVPLDFINVALLNAVVNLEKPSSLGELRYGPLLGDVSPTELDSNSFFSELVRTKVALKFLTGQDVIVVRVRKAKTGLVGISSNVRFIDRRVAETAEEPEELQDYLLDPDELKGLSLDERVHRMSEALIDPAKTPPIPLPAEKYLVPMRVGRASLQLADVKQLLPQYNGRPLLLLNAMQQLRDEPRIFNQIQEAGFLPNRSPRAAYGSFKPTHTKLNSLFRTPRLRGNLVEADGSRPWTSYILHPYVVFFNEEGEQLSPTLTGAVFIDKGIPESEPRQKVPDRQRVKIDGTPQPVHELPGGIPSTGTASSPSLAHQVFERELTKIDPPAYYPPRLSGHFISQTKGIDRGPEDADIDLEDKTLKRAVETYTEKMGSKLEYVRGALRLIFGLPGVEVDETVWKTALANSRDIYEAVGMLKIGPLELKNRSRADVILIIRDAIKGTDDPLLQKYLRHLQNLE